MKQPGMTGSAPSVFLRLGRVSNLPTVWSNVLAGAVLSGAAVQHYSQLLLLMIAFTAFYTAGMYLNDAFDSVIDSRERPTRPIPAGEISRQAVFMIGAALLAGAMVLLATFGTTALLSGLLLAGVIVLYNAWHKNNPASPILMGICRALVYLAPAGALGAVAGTPLMLAAAAVFAHIIGLSYAAKQEYRNRIQNWWPLLILALPVLYYLFDCIVQNDARSMPHQALGVALLVALIVAIGAALQQLFKGAIPRAVTQLIAATSLLDALAVHSAGGGIGAIVFCLAAYVLTRIFQTRIAGT